MIKILRKIDTTPLLEAYTQLESSVQWTSSGHKGRQAGLQNILGEDVWSSAVGKSQGNDLNCAELNSAIKDTIFEDVINEYKLTRTRLMWVNPYSCYSMHHDKTPRIHVPLITNANCYFVFNTYKEKRIQYLPAGFVYWVDTRHLHTFMNTSDHPRLHLVGVVEE
jgi:hypothetical protein